MIKFITIIFLVCSVYANTGEEIFTQVDPVVVSIGHEKATGSGFIISKDGYILTNGHVISSMNKERPKDTAKRITVTLNNEKKFQAKVIGFSLDPDVALLKIKAPYDLPVAKIFHGDVKTAEVCYAVGSPLGLKRTITDGIISNTTQLSLRTFTPVLQTNANINPGNSGGPLFNAKGEVIGINTYGSSRGNGIGFSIPIKYALVLKDHFLKYGYFKRSTISYLLLDNLDEDLQKKLNSPKGVVIQHVLKDSLADKVGFKGGDVITHLNGKEVAAKDELELFNFFWNIIILDVGTKLNFSIWRDGKVYNKAIKTTEDEPSLNRGVQLGELEEHYYPILGFAVQKVTSDSFFYYNLSSTKGVLVSRVSNAVMIDASINKFDVITHVNNVKINNENDFIKTVNDLLKKQEKYFVFKINRSNQKNMAVIKPTYKLIGKKIFILANEDNEYLSLYKNQLLFNGAKVTISNKIPKEQDFDAILLADYIKNEQKKVLKLLSYAATKKLIVGASNIAPLYLTKADNFYRKLKMTIAKDSSELVLKQNIKYTGEEKTRDKNLITSNGFDYRNEQAFIQQFIDMIEQNYPSE